MRLRYSDEATPVCLRADCIGFTMMESEQVLPRNELLSCKERSDDSSELVKLAMQAGISSDDGRRRVAAPAPECCRAGSALHMASCGLRCKAGLHDPLPQRIESRLSDSADIARPPCAGNHDGDVPTLR